MSWLDLVIFGVIALSALISLIRGFVKESISLITWVVAGMVAFRYFLPMAELLKPYIEADTVRLMVAGGALFVCTLIIGAIINFIAGQLVAKTGLSGTDRALGVVFGGARGLLIVTMLVLLASLTPAPESNVWKESLSTDFFQGLAEWVRTVIPQDAIEKFSF